LKLFLLRNHPFCNVYMDPYTSCGMGGSATRSDTSQWVAEPPISQHVYESVYIFQNGWFRNSLGGVRTYCRTTLSATCIRIRIHVAKWVVSQHIWTSRSVTPLLLRRAVIVPLLRRCRWRKLPTHTTTYNLAPPPSSHLWSPTSIYCFIISQNQG